MPSVKISFTPSRKRLTVKVVDQDEVLASFKLKAKKTLDGNIIIFDHDDIDIILRPEQKKVVTFKKDNVNGDIAYGASDRMFKYLAKKGVISIDSVQGGSTLDSFEVTIPYFEYGEDYEDMMRDRLIEPDGEESTELGEVPQDKQKGSIVPGYYRSPYWMSYILENQE